MTNVRMQERKRNGTILSVITLITISAQLTEKKRQKCKPPGLAGCLLCRALDPGTS